MINLLPSDVIIEIQYARRNTLLLKACTATVLVIIGVILVLGSGQVYLSTTTKKYESDVTSFKKTLQDQNIDSTKKEIQALSNNVNLSLRVLSKEILFSKLLRQAGTVMPPGSSLSSLEINDAKGGIDIAAGVQNYQVGTQVQINLADPKNNLFQKVDLISVGCSEQQASNGYPCSANFRALFSEDNQYMFINQKAMRNK